MSGLAVILRLRSGHAPGPLYRQVRRGRGIRRRVSDRRQPQGRHCPYKPAGRSTSILLGPEAPRLSRCELTDASGHIGRSPLPLSCGGACGRRETVRGQRGRRSAWSLCVVAQRRRFAVKRCGGGVRARTARRWRVVRSKPCGVQRRHGPPALKLLRCSFLPENARDSECYDCG